MRVWLDPQKMAYRDLTASDVVAGRPAAERPGGRRPDRPAAGAQGAGVPVHHDHAGTAGRRRPVRRHDPQDRRPGPAGPPARRRPHRAGRPGLRPDLHARRPALGGAVDLPVARLQRPEDRQAWSAPRWRSSRRISRRAWTTRSSTTPRPSSPNRSTKSSRRSATPCSWWPSWCWCSCRTGGRRSSRWWPCRWPSSAPSP